MSFPDPVGGERAADLDQGAAHELATLECRVESGVFVQLAVEAAVDDPAIERVDAHARTETDPENQGGLPRREKGGVVPHDVAKERTAAGRVRPLPQGTVECYRLGREGRDLTGLGRGHRSTIGRRWSRRERTLRCHAGDRAQDDANRQDGVCVRLIRHWPRPLSHRVPCTDASRVPSCPNQFHRSVE